MAYRVTSFQTIPDAVLRIGLAAEQAFNAGSAFDLTINFPSYAAALSFRNSIYSTRAFLRKLHRRDKSTISYYLEVLSGLDRLSVAALDRATAESDLDLLGHVPVRIYTRTHSADVTAQLDNLGLPDFTAHTQLREPASAAPSPTPSLPSDRPSSEPVFLPVSDDVAALLEATQLLINGTPFDRSCFPNNDTWERAQALMSAYNRDDYSRARLYLRRLLDSLQGYSNTEFLISVLQELSDLIANK
ncbi:MAG: hypothetical protein [Siphoviridae sp. ct7UA22]|nr:MAG: hypothetical protein [Siphoviridae sp. ct7UA22]